MIKLILILCISLQLIVADNEYEKENEKESDDQPSQNNYRSYQARLYQQYQMNRYRAYQYEQYRRLQWQRQQQQLRFMQQQQRARLIMQQQQRQIIQPVVPVPVPVPTNPPTNRQTPSPTLPPNLCFDQSHLEKYCGESQLQTEETCTLEIFPDPDTFPRIVHLECKKQSDAKQYLFYAVTGDPAGYHCGIEQDRNVIIEEHRNVPLETQLQLYQGEWFLMREYAESHCKRK